MLSRLGFASSRSGQFKALQLQFQIRACHHVTSPGSQQQKHEGQVKIIEGPERDLVNFPRRMRPIYPGKVRIGFIPDEWFQFFYKKTGVTGPYAFGAGLLTYLFSKELWVMEHRFYEGMGMILFIVIVVKAFGPQISAFLQKEIDNHDGVWAKFRTDSVENLKRGIKLEGKSQWSATGQKVLFDAKRENVHLQLEAEYRARLMHVYQQVKKRLDYQLEIQNASSRLEQRHMVKWIVDNVMKNITPQQEKEAIQQCISQLKTLAAKA